MVNMSNFIVNCSSTFELFNNVNATESIVNMYTFFCFSFKGKDLIRNLGKYEEKGLWEDSKKTPFSYNVRETTTQQPTLIVGELRLTLLKRRAFNTARNLRRASFLLEPGFWDLFCFVLSQQSKVLNTNAKLVSSKVSFLFRKWWIVNNTTRKDQHSVHSVTSKFAWRLLSRYTCSPICKLQKKEPTLATTF